MHYILLTPAESIIGISSDAALSAFAVHYDDGTTRRVGPGQSRDVAEVPEDAKMFAIDGPGGERVVKVEVGMNSLPMALKVRFLQFPIHLTIIKKAPRLERAS